MSQFRCSIRRPGHALLLLLLFCAAGLGAQSNASVSISGSVAGGSGKNPIYVAVWSDSGFLTKPVQQVQVAPGAQPVFQFRVPPGEYALSAFEDKNGNGVLDMGAFGPKEPSGFWRAFHAWRNPRFSDVSSRYDKDASGIQIRLH